MKSKIGWHLQQEYEGLIRERPGKSPSGGSLGYYSPPVVKIVWTDTYHNGLIWQVRQANPKAYIVVRPYEPTFGTSRDTDPGILVRDMRIRMGDVWGHIDALEGLNENNPTNTPEEPDTAKRLADWYREFGIAVEAAGKTPVVCNWSTGQPWDMAVWDLFTVKPNWIVGLHAYYNPRYINNWAVIDFPAVVASYRYLKETKGPRWVLLTEYGTEPALYESDEAKKKTPWWEFYSPEQFVQNAIDHDQAFQRSIGEHYLGLCWFTFGGPGWEHLEVNRRAVDAMHPELREAEKVYVSRTLPPTKKEEPVSDGNWKGIDVSIWAGSISDAKWKAAAAEGVRAAVVQAYGRKGTNTYGKNPHCEGQLSGARMAGLKTAIYVNIPASDDVGAWPTMDEAKAAAGSEFEHVSFVALDIEGERPLHPEEPAARLNSALTWIQENEDKFAVIYTSAYMWKRVMPGVPSYMNNYIPLWDADYDKDPRLDVFMSYGGWTKRYGKQHTPSVMGPGGIWCDLNTFDPVLFEDEPDPPSTDWKTKYENLQIAVGAMLGGIDGEIKKFANWLEG